MNLKGDMAQLTTVPTWAWEGEWAEGQQQVVNGPSAGGPGVLDGFPSSTSGAQAPGVRAELVSLTFTTTVTFSVTQGWLCPSQVVPMPKGKNSEGGWHVVGAQHV